jgi:hypothetical protein
VFAAGASARLLEKSEYWWRMQIDGVEGWVLPVCVCVCVCACLCVSVCSLCACSLPVTSDPPPTRQSLVQPAPPPQPRQVSVVKRRIKVRRAVLSFAVIVSLCSPAGPAVTESRPVTAAAAPGPQRRGAVRGGGGGGGARVDLSLSLSLSFFLCTHPDRHPPECAAGRGGARAVGRRGRRAGREAEAAAATGANGARAAGAGEGKGQHDHARAARHLGRARAASEDGEWCGRVRFSFVRQLPELI